MSYAVESVNWGDIVAMIRRIPVFQQEAVCLTKFGPELGETAKEILARKDLERRSGIRAHKNEFWWGIGEKGTAQSINNLISQYNATIVLFSAIKNQEPPKNGSSSDAFVWRKYRMLGGDILHDIPKHVLITSAAVTKSGTVRTTHFALICNSSHTNQDGRARLQICQPSLQKYQQRRHAWEDRKRATDHHSTSQVDDLPNLRSGVR